MSLVFGAVHETNSMSVLSSSSPTTNSVTSMQRQQARDCRCVSFEDEVAACDDDSSEDDEADLTHSCINPSWQGHFIAE